MMPDPAGRKTDESRRTQDRGAPDGWAHRCRLGAHRRFRTQKLTAFVFPAIYVVSGGTLPFGVLLYWLTSNTWTMAQQGLLIRREFCQRFSRQPGLPVQFVAGKAHRRALTAEGLRRGMPESGHHRGFRNVDALTVKQP